MCILFGFSAKAEKSEQDSLIVSVITCEPGREIYELCGHGAIRVRGMMNGAPIDSVWNYGIFDFAQPNFVYRFVKGETDYRVAGYPFKWFMPEYVEAGRGVTEQDLALSQKEAKRVLGLLRVNTLPGNRVYRYNYVRDNCATRITNILDAATERRIIYPDSINYGTFRKEMRAYHKAYPWYQFGIDLALGSGLDQSITGREEMFVPVEMMRKNAYAKFEDGSPLVRETRILNPDSGHAVDAPTPWYLTPIAIAVLILLISLTIAIVEIKKGRVFRIVYSLWYGVCGLAGCLVSFLVFISEHEATSPNLLIIWLNPLQLIFAITIWSRKLRWLNIGLAWYNIITMVCMLLVWAFQGQSANIAFFPLMGVTLVLAVAYALVGAQKGNNIYNEKNRIFGAGEYSRDKRGGTSRNPNRRRAQARGGHRG